MAEYHIRYGGYGGIAYHHIADNYIALFTHFIPCGTWEAIYILDGLLKNESDIQPDTLHSDTQGQSSPVFAFAFLLGIKLMPRIRNFGKLDFSKASKNIRYKNLSKLFTKNVNWDLIESKWEEMMQVVISVKLGKITSASILKKLGSYSKRNSLYKAFNELGEVVRTMFLIDYLNDPVLRKTINDETNKVESFHNFADWLSFGDNVIRENHTDRQEKMTKYKHLLANAVILQNAVDLTNVLSELRREGVNISQKTIEGMSPYFTKKVRRFGYFDVDFPQKTEPFPEVEKLENILIN